MVQPVENVPGVLGVQDGPIVNGDIAPPAAPAVPAVPAAPAAGDAAAAPAAAAAGQAARAARPVGLPGPRRRPVLPAAQLLGTEWRTSQLLAALPVVEHLSRRGQRQHRRLVQANWVYMMVFVYGAFIYKAVTLGGAVGGGVIGRGIDASLFNLLTYFVDRYPFLRARPEVLRTNTKSFLHGDRRQGWLSRVAVTVAFFTAQPLVLSLNLCSICLRLWSGIITQLWNIMNDDRSLLETELGEVAMLSVGRAVALFWRLPFNVFYTWVAVPLLIHPGEFIKYLHDQLQDLVVPDVPGVDGADIAEAEEEGAEEAPEGQAPALGEAPALAREGGDQPAAPEVRDNRAAA